MPHLMLQSMDLVCMVLKAVPFLIFAVVKFNTTEYAMAEVNMELEQETQNSNQDNFRNRQKQPWLIFLAHRVLGYSSTSFYAVDGAFGEPIGRDSLQKLWQKYKVDIAIYGHAHNYERTCPIYEVLVHVEVRLQGKLKRDNSCSGGRWRASLTNFANINATWSLVKDVDYGFLKLTSSDPSNLLFEQKKSSSGKVYDSFTISRDYKDILV
ncbi:probable inactive purple acid phosphatase 1 isoform X1 [Tanacetum coccineum]